VAVAIPAQRVHYAISVSGITSRFPMSKAVEVAREIRQIVSELTEQPMPPIKPYS
jgi:DNA-binding IclR family transcriptional regulator